VLPTTEDLPLADFGQGPDISGVIWTELFRCESMPRKVTIHNRIVSKSKKRIIDAIQETETVFRGPEKGDARDFEIPPGYSWRSYLGLNSLISPPVYRFQMPSSPLIQVLKDFGQSFIGITLPN